jgi:hypothetical protein
MRNISARSGKVALFFVIALLTASAAFSQVKLREAMDTDADGKADLTIFRPSTNVWWTAKSAGGLTATNFGLASEDFMAPGD